MDAGGVALAAIQGLDAKLEAKVDEQARELAARDAEIALLRSVLADLRLAVDVLIAREASNRRVAVR